MRVGDSSGSSPLWEPRPSNTSNYPEIDALIEKLHDPSIVTTSIETKWVEIRDKDGHIRRVEVHYKVRHVDPSVINQLKKELLLDDTSRTALTQEQRDHVTDALHALENADCQTAIDCLRQIK